MCTEMHFKQPAMENRRLLECMGSARAQSDFDEAIQLKGLFFPQRKQLQMKINSFSLKECNVQH
jgi:hypothetical protein